MTPALAATSRPHSPAAIDDLLALDVAALGAHADHAPSPVIQDEVGDLGVLEDPRAALPGALGHRHRHVDRVGPALVRRPEAVDDVVGAHQRHQVAPPRAATARPWSSRPSACTPSRDGGSRRPAASWPAGGSRTAGTRSRARSPPRAARRARRSSAPSRARPRSCRRRPPRPPRARWCRRSAACAPGAPRRARPGGRGGRRSTCRSRRRRRRRTAPGPAGRREGECDAASARAAAGLMAVKSSDMAAACHRLNRCSMDA